MRTILILVFAVTLGWLPAGGFPGWEAGLLPALSALLLPAVALALPQAGILTRVTRTAVLDVLGEDFVRTARAKGLTEKTVVLKHVLRNSLIPVVTVIALGLPAVFGGAIITEQVFQVNGLGQLLISAIHANDIPMVLTLTFIFAILIVVFTLIADLLYGVLDPRIRYD